MTRLSGYGVMVLVTASVCTARVDIWPRYFAVPEVETSEDSSRLELDTRQTALENTFESHDRLTLSRRDSLHSLEQVAGYELVNDHVLRTTDQHLDLSGRYERHGRRWTGTALGFDWSPSFLLHTRDSGSGFLGTIDMGPTIGVTAHGVPIRLNGGVTGRKWSDALPREISTDWLDMMNSDFGIYAGAVVGEGQERVGNLPLFVGGKGYARLIESTSRLSVGSGQGLLAHRLVTGDSVFAYFADTLVWGHDRFFNKQGTYVEVPERRAHSFRLAGGIKASGERPVVPGVAYSFTQYSEVFPVSNTLRDRRDRRHSIIVLAEVDSFLTLSYSGGVKVRWEFDDHLHRHDLGVELESGKGDSLYLANLRDLHETGFGMTHELARRLASGFELRYLFDIYREKKVYPSFFISRDPGVRASGDTLRSYDDHYWITQQHTAELTVPVFFGLRTVLSGSYFRNTSQFIRSRLSGGNNDTRTYSLGLNMDFAPSERFTVREAAKMEANVTQYSFPEVHRHPFDPPPYSRTFSSVSRVQWAALQWFSLIGELEAIYWDDGYWNGHEYYDPATEQESPGGAGVDYYAISRKSLDTWLVMSGRVTVFDRVAFTVGSKFGNVYYREWDSLRKAYVENSLGIGPLYLEPFLEVRSTRVVAVKLGGQIKRVIHDPLNGLRDEAPADYWEAGLVCRAQF